MVLVVIPEVYLLQKPQSRGPNIEDYEGWTCGGVIIHPLYILTSGTCLADVQYAYVISGYRRYVSAKHLDTDECLKRKRKKIIAHCGMQTEDYNVTEYYNSTTWTVLDLATARVDSPFEFHDPAYLTYCSYKPTMIKVNYHKKYEAPGTIGVALGWGHTKYFRQLNDKTDYNQEELQYTSTVIVDKAKCAQVWQSRFNLKKSFTYLMLCTYGAGNIDDNGVPTNYVDLWKNYNDTYKEGSSVYYSWARRFLNYLRPYPLEKVKNRRKRQTEDEEADRIPDPGNDDANVPDETDPNKDPDAQEDVDPTDDPNAAVDTEPTEDPNVPEETVPTEDPNIPEKTDPTEDPNPPEVETPDPNIPDETDPTEDPNIPEETEPTEDPNPPEVETPDPNIPDETDPTEDANITEETEPTEGLNIPEETEPTEDPNIPEETEPTEDPNIPEETEPTEDPNIPEETEPTADPSPPEETEATTEPNPPEDVETPDPNIPDETDPTEDPNVPNETETTLEPNPPDEGETNTDSNSPDESKTTTDSNVPDETDPSKDPAEETTITNDDNEQTTTQSSKNETDANDKTTKPTDAPKTTKAAEKIDFGPGLGNGICQNDHGSPLVAWIGGHETVIGVASGFIVTSQMECKGPFLFSSTACANQLIRCTVAKKERRRLMGCDDFGQGYKIIEREIAWRDGADTGDAFAPFNYQDAYELLAN